MDLGHINVVLKQIFTHASIQRTRNRTQQIQNSSLILDFYLSLFMLRCTLLVSCILILVMSLFMFQLFTCILHCQLLVLFIFVISLHVCVFMYTLKLLLCEFWWLMFIVYACVQTQSYISFRSHLFTCILFMWFAQSWCQYFYEFHFLDMNMICVHCQEAQTRTIRDIQTLEYEVTSVEVSGDITKSRYTETFYNWSIHFTRGHYRIVETHIHMNMAIQLKIWKRREMRIHFQIHGGRYQRKEDADRTKVQAYSQVYAYINRHRDIGVY